MLASLVDAGARITIDNYNKRMRKSFGVMVQKYVDKYQS